MSGPVLAKINQPAREPSRKPLVLAAREPGRKPLVLAVDDDRTMLMVLVDMLERLNNEVITARNGRDALAMISERKADIDAILLDREMPEMDGLTVLERMREEPALARIPVIMQTGSGRPEQVREGINAGVFYYLTKPIDETILGSVLAAAIRERMDRRRLAAEMSQHASSFLMMAKGMFRFRSLPEAEQLASFLAQCFPDPERVLSGLAELLINAVEHGNLGITYDEKSSLVEAGNWREEVLRRADLPEHKGKFVEVAFDRDNDGYAVTIKDRGPGFDWKKFLQIDPARAGHNHGRGIAQANMMSFDRLVFNDSGNEVTGFVGVEPVLEW